MAKFISNVALVVRDYDEAIAFFTDVLGFQLSEDTDMGNGKRWVVVSPDGTGASLLLAKAANPEQLDHAGNQTGGRVFLFLRTSDFDGDYQRMLAAGVRFTEEPRHEPFGKVVVFLDLYGNKWDLIQHTA